MPKRMAIIAALPLLLAWIAAPSARAQHLEVPFTVAKPAGDGPFPAVVIMHDCSGLGPKSSGAPWRWSADLVRWGYVTIWPDSFSTRGHADGVCREPARANVGPRARVRDALAALDHLRSLPFVDPRRIAIMGGSHGGTSTLAAIEAAHEAAQNSTFAAAVALYPSCKIFGAGVNNKGSERTYRTRTPTLILVGDLDDWTPAADCERLVAASKGLQQPIDIEVFKGAHHSFDSPARINFDPNRINSSAPAGRGATTGGNPEAWEKARNAVRDFLAQKLGRADLPPR